MPIQFDEPVEEMYLDEETGETFFYDPRVQDEEEHPCLQWLWHEYEMEAQW